MPDLSLIQTPNLSQRLEQKMTPAQLQSLELLQAGSLELQQRVEQELLQNPVLLELQEPNVLPESDLQIPERREDAERNRELDSDAKEYNREVLQKVVEFGDDEFVNNRSTARDFDAEERRQHFFDSFSREPGLYAQLEREIDQEYSAQPQLAALGKNICGDIDERGFLRSTDEELAQENGASLEEVRAAVKALQQLDPPGIGARNLRECLLLQLERKRLVGSLEWDIVDKHLEDLARNRIPQIAAAIDAEIGEVQDAAERIRALDQHPAWQLACETAQTVVPDVFIERTGDALWSVRSNRDAVPQLVYEEEYVRMYADPDITPETKRFLAEKFNSAQQLITAIDQRQRTVTRVAMALLELQPDFFRTGRDSDLRPLILAKVAERLQLSEGTVSRTIANKYISTPWGTRSFKSFFGFGYRTQNGEEVSALKIRARIREMIAAEDPAKPLSDNDISKALAAEGTTVKRRTVVKYRELENIPASSLRKIH